MIDIFKKTTQISRNLRKKKELYLLLCHTSLCRVCSCRAGIGVIDLNFRQINITLLILRFQIFTDVSYNLCGPKSEYINSIDIV